MINQPELKRNKASLLKKVVKCLLFFIVVVSVYAVVIELIFQQKKLTAVVKTEYWSHRGKNNEALPENSIAAFESVLKKGLTGIEVDVFWSEEKNQLIVTHDSPVVNGRYITLNEVAARFRDSVSYWIDFKNLEAESMAKINAAFSQIESKYHVQNKFYVESSNAGALRLLSSKAIKKLYWLQYNRSFPFKQLKLLYLKSQVVFGDFDGYTCGYSFYDRDFKNNFGQLPLYIFHANAEQLKAESKISSSIKVQLVDEDYLK